MVFYIYLIGIIDNIRCGAKGLAITGIGLGVMGIALWAMSYAESASDSILNLIKKWVTRCFILGGCAIPFTMFIPSGTTLSAMFLIPAIVDNQSVQNISDKSMKLLENKLDQWLNENSKQEDK